MDTVVFGAAVFVTLIFTGMAFMAAVFTAVTPMPVALTVVARTPVDEPGLMKFKLRSTSAADSVGQTDGRLSWRRVLSTHIPSWYKLSVRALFEHDIGPFPRLVIDQTPFVP